MSTKKANVTNLGALYKKNVKKKLKKRKDLEKRSKFIEIQLSMVMCINKVQNF